MNEPFNEASSHRMYIWRGVPSSLVAPSVSGVRPRPNKDGIQLRDDDDVAAFAAVVVAGGLDDLPFTPI
jgi:hypothetical protein